MITLNSEAKKLRIVQYKLMPLPTKTKYWVLHVQVGRDGTKKDGDYMSHSIVVPNEVARDLLSYEGTEVEFYPSFRPGSMQGYMRRLTQEGAQFFGSEKFLERFSYSFRQYIEALTSPTKDMDTWDEPFQICMEEAQEEMASMLEEKVMKETLKNLVGLHSNTEGETTH